MYVHTNTHTYKHLQSKLMYLILGYIYLQILYINSYNKETQLHFPVIIDKIFGKKLISLSHTYTYAYIT